MDPDSNDRAASETAKRPYERPKIERAGSVAATTLFEPPPESPDQFQRRLKRP